MAMTTEIDESVSSALQARSDLSPDEIKTLLDLVRADERRECAEWIRATFPESTTIANLMRDR
jgi:hypothetical protein